MPVAALLRFYCATMLVAEVVVDATATEGGWIRAGIGTILVESQMTFCSNDSNGNAHGEMVMVSA